MRRSLKSLAGETSFSRHVLGPLSQAIESPNQVLQITVLVMSLPHSKTFCGSPLPLRQTFKLHRWGGAAPHDLPQVHLATHCPCRPLFTLSAHPSPSQGPCHLCPSPRLSCETLKCSQHVRLLQTESLPQPQPAFTVFDSSSAEEEKWPLCS